MTRIRPPLRNVHAPMWRALPARCAESGSITVLIVFLALSLVLVAGLVFDAGAALTDRQRATDIAEQAARYAADQLEPAPAGATPLINSQQAHAAGMRFLAQEHVHGTVAATTTHVTVTVTITHHTALLSAVGRSTLTVTGTSTAIPLSGLRTDSATGSHTGSHPGSHTGGH